MMFEKEIYLQRRKALMEKVGNGLVLLLGNGEIGRNYTANEYRFRQDSTFLYYTGLNHPHLVAIFDTEEHSAYLFGNDFSMEDLIWVGSHTPMKAIAASTGIHNTYSLDKVQEVLAKAVAKGRSIHFLPPYRLENSIHLQQWLQIPLQELKGKASNTLIQAVVQQRSVKQDVELAAMEEAVNLSRAIHIALMKRAKAGMKEAVLAGIAEGIARADGNGLAYFPIVTVQGQTLHNHVDQNTLKAGQMVLADVGAENTLGYAGDITRTFPVSKRFTVQQKEIYELVLEANEMAIAHIRPGVLYRDIHFMAARVLVEGLKALGLMQGDTETIVAEGAHALFMPHGLGHAIGLDVHDMEDLGEEFVGYTTDIQRSKQFGAAYLRFAKALQVGYTLTVEPGIYFIPALIDSWQKERKFAQFINYQQLQGYRNFTGIRIEDDILVTSEGCRVLGNPIPKTIKEVEALRGG
jgi:Xaa-Pro aminopeptidase